ncbi:MAG: hypothetical protein V1494_00775 [Candidatus Diapherotrites archaeon]
MRTFRRRDNIPRRRGSKVIPEAEAAGMMPAHRMKNLKERNAKILSVMRELNELQKLDVKADPINKEYDDIRSTQPLSTLSTKNPAFERVRKQMHDITQSRSKIYLSIPPKIKHLLEHSSKYGITGKAYGLLKEIDALVDSATVILNQKNVLRKLKELMQELQRRGE